MSGAASGWKGGFRPLVEEVGHQRQGQGVAVGEVEHAVDLRRGHAPPLQEDAAVRRGEVAQRQDAHHRLPAGVGAPRRGRRLAAGQNHKHAGGQRRQELLAQPAVDGRQQLVGIHQQQQALAPVGQMAHDIGVRRKRERLAQGGKKEVGRGFDVAAVELNTLDAYLMGNVAVFAQESGLADAARPKDTEDREGQLRFAEGSAQPVALTDAADKLPSSGLFQPLLQRKTGHRLVLGAPTL
jgi:hypothetical protein